MKTLFNVSLLRMLVIALCIGSATQMQGITIKVLKGGTAPYLYAWTGTAPNATELTGTFPGTQFTNKDANGYWTMEIPNQTTINLIFAMSEDGPQTNDILNVTGVNGVASFMYDGGSKWFSTMPQLESTEGYIYFNCPPDWGNYNEDGHRPYVYFLDSNGNQLGVNGWPGWEMSYEGLDGAGFQVYKYQTGNWTGISKLIFNCGSSTHQTGNLGYVANGYYNTEGCQASVHALNSTNGYADANFRAAIASQLGITDGSVFVPSNVTYLDVSNKGISSLAGISNFTNLQTLLASHNNLTWANFQSNENTLEVLDLSHNSGLSTTYTNPAQVTGNGRIYIYNCSELKELYLNDCNFNAIGVGNLTKLEKLIVDNNTALGNISTLSGATNLKYVSLQNCGLTNEIGFGNNPALEYIDISNNSTTAKNFKLSNNQSLKVFKAHNAAIKENGLTWETASLSLDTLIASGNTAMKYLNSLNYASNLKYLDMSGGDLYLQDMPTFTGTSFPLLDYIDFSNDKITEAKTLQAFPALKTLKIGGNFLTSNSHGIDKITLNNCPAIEAIDVSGSRNMAEIALINQGYTNANFRLPTITYVDCNLLSMLDMSNNGFTSVPILAGIPSTIVSLKLNSNALSSLIMPSGSPIQFLYAENNTGFTGNYELTAEAAGNLKGLDLGNNGFTSFKAEGTALSALMIGDNTSLTTLELHGNNNLTCTTAETTMSEGSGLYLLGNTALTTINIENSSFDNIGANGSLNGLSAVTTLRAKNNKFETFTNSNYSPADARSKDLATIVGKPSLEDLTGLVYLDLSHNQLKDSVHLYRNINLKHLDVSHNQVLGDLPSNDTEREAMITKKLTTCLKYGVGINGDSVNHYIGPVGKSITLTDAIKAQITRYDPYREETRYADFRPCDLRDTVGLYHLDLHYNTQLEYIDISSTNIHNTANGRKYMNPGWESSPDGWDGWVETYHPNALYGPVKHHFIYLQTATNLRVLKADNNNMQSLGTAHNQQLDTLSARYMYGDCHFMSGHPYDDYIGYGSKEFNSPNCQNARYIDFSYGSFYSFDPTNLTNVEKLILTGNPLGGGKYPNYVLDVTHNSKLQQLQADQCTDLQTIEAHDLNDLAILDVTGNTALKILRAYNDPVLYSAQTDFITGLSTCSNLEELWVSNDNLPELEVWNNKKLTTLKCYDNGILPLLDLTENKFLSYLDFHNCKLNEIDLSKNTALTYIDCSSPSVANNIGETGKNKLSDLDIPADAPIQTVIANCNDLHRITGVNKASLTRLEFEHNHINGIDLSNTGLTDATLKDEDNGRTIDAEYSIVTVKDASNNPVYYDLYFFQVDSLASNGGVFLGSKLSYDNLKGATRDILTEEGVVSTKITAWTDHATGPIVGGRRGNNYIDPNNLNTLIDTEKVVGTIVALDEHNKTAKYTYDTGVSGHTSTYYLNWNAPSDPTAVTDIETDNKPIITGGIGAITIQAPEGTTIGIYDMAGRLVQQFTASGSEIVVDGMVSGVYIVNGQKVIVK